MVKKSNFNNSDIIKLDNIAKLYKKLYFEDNIIVETLNKIIVRSSSTSMTKNSDF